MEAIDKCFEDGWRQSNDVDVVAKSAALKCSLLKGEKDGETRYGMILARAPTQRDNGTGLLKVKISINGESGTYQNEQQFYETEGWSHIIPGVLTTEKGVGANAATLKIGDTTAVMRIVPGASISQLKIDVGGVEGDAAAARGIEEGVAMLGLQWSPTEGREATGEVPAMRAGLHADPTVTVPKKTITFGQLGNQALARMAGLTTGQAEGRRTAGDLAKYMVVAAGTGDVEAACASRPRWCRATCQAIPPAAGQQGGCRRSSGAGAGGEEQGARSEGAAAADWAPHRGLF